MAGHWLRRLFPSREEKLRRATERYHRRRAGEAAVRSAHSDAADDVDAKARARVGDHY
jgi:hypothetical protein